MDPRELSDAGQGGERRALALLTLSLALVFAAYFVLRAEMPDLPLHVHEALSSIPLWPAGS